MKKLFIFFLFLMFILPLATAELLTFDNVKTYDATTQEVLIKNTFGIGADLARVKLNTPLENKVGIGYVKVAELELTSYDDYRNLLSSMDFYNIKTGMSKIELEFDYKYKSYENYEVNDYEKVLSTNLKNGTAVYDYKIIGTHLEQREVWYPLEKLDYIKGDVLTIGIWTTTYEGQKVEWIPTIAGLKINEFASWTAGLNTGLISYYKFEGDYIDSVNASSPLTNHGLVNDSGKILSGVNTTGNLYADRTYGSIPVGTNALTVCVWDYVTASSTSAMFGMGTFGDGGLGFILGIETKYILWGFYHDVTDPNNAILNQWNLVCGVQVNGNARQLWVNGVNVANGTESYNIGTTYPVTIGRNPQSPQDHKGKIDEVGIWNRALTQAEITQLYNGGVGITYTNDFGAISINLNSPIDAYKTNNTNVTLNWTIYPSTVNITNYTLEVFYANGTRAYTNTNTGLYGSNNLTATNNAFLYSDNSYIWGVTSCGNKSAGTIFCGSSANRTFSVESVMPEITLTSPTGNQGYLYLGKTLNLNYSVVESNVDKCWYNYNGTNIFVNCTLNTTTFIQEANDYNLTFYANDTFGNSNSAFTSWSYNIFEVARGFNNETIEGSQETYTLNLTRGTSLQISNIILNFNGQNDAAQLFVSGNNVYSINTLLIESVVADTNKTFYFTITLTDGTIFNTTSAVQLVRNIGVDNCSVNNYPILYLYLKDEESRNPINGAIQTTLEVINNQNYGQVLNFSQETTESSSASLCSNIQLNVTDFLLNAEIRYNAENHSAEFYHLQRAALTSSPINLSLFDLLTEDTTLFKIIYRNQDLVGVEGAILQLQRKYISEDIYETVEAPITSSDSSGILHIDTNTNKYQITVVKNGVVLGIFQNLAFICQSELTGECTLNLFDKLNPPNIANIVDIQDFEAFIETSIDNQTITVTFTIPSGIVEPVQVVAVQQDTILGNKTICNTTLISSAGSVECSYNTTIQDSTITLKVYKDGILLAQKGYIVQEDLRSDWGGINYILLVVLILSLVFMALASPEWMVINAVITVLIGGGIWLVRGISFVEGLGAIMWLILAVIILVSKMSQQEDR